MAPCIYARAQERYTEGQKIVLFVTCDLLCLSCKEKIVTFLFLGCPEAATVPA
jgi:hypothetical protein